MSLIDPISCGFAKVYVYQLLTKKSGLEKLDSEGGKNFKGRELKFQFGQYNKHFESDNFVVDYNVFKTKFPAIIDNIKTLAKTSAATRDELFKTFSPDTWKSLLINKKSSHQIFECKGCLNSRPLMTGLSKFFINKKLKAKAVKFGLFKQTVLKEVTNVVQCQLDRTYKESFNTTFTKQFKTQFVEDQKREYRKAVRKVRNDIKTQLDETSIERTFATGMSLRNRQKIRLSASFEDFASAKKRTIETKSAIKQGLKRPLNHVGDFDNYVWESNSCLLEVNSYSDGHLINYTELARRFKIKHKDGHTPNNAGQVVKEFLLENGSDLKRFKPAYSYTHTSSVDSDRIRKKKRRIGNIDVSFPVEQTNQLMMKDVKQKIKDGVYSIGELVVPQSFEKLIFKDGEIEVKQVTIEGRKEQLLFIRKKWLKIHEKYYRFQSDEFYDQIDEERVISELKRIGCYDKNCTNRDRTELKKLQRQRHFIFWHDGSTISNHSHLLMMIACLYDKAIHLTNNEYEELYGTKIDVQAVIEKPEFYLLARCPSDDSQIMYSDTRLEDIRNLSEDLTTDNGITVKDKMKFFKGDGPAAQFEAGQQKGGDYFCWACDVFAGRADDLTYVLNTKYVSLQDRITLLLESSRSQALSRRKELKIFKNIQKTEIISELHERRVAFRCDDKKEKLENLLKVEVHGIQRVPALLFNCPFDNLNKVNLQEYDILPCEPLHDVTGHIKNLFAEMPNHLIKEQKIDFEKAITASFEGKDAKRGCDYRASLIKLCILLNEKIDQNAYKILTTCCEIQEILYSQEEKRSKENILRLYNVTFNHAILIKSFFKSKLRHITTRKLYGKYFHSLIRHSADQYRLISGRSTNSEQEERTFNFLKTVSSSTSNHHPEHVLLNSILRIQVKESLEKPNEKSKQSSLVSKLFNEANLQKSPTFFTFKWIKNNPYLYQSHLERIADYLTEEKMYWEENEEGVVFNDVEFVQNSQKNVHHFRSMTLKGESQYVSKCWSDICIPNANILIPAQKIKTESETGEIGILYLSTLTHFQGEKIDETVVPLIQTTDLEESDSDNNNNNNYIDHVDDNDDNDADEILSIKPVNVLEELDETSNNLNQQQTNIQLYSTPISQPKSKDKAPVTPQKIFQKPLEIKITPIASENKKSKYTVQSNVTNELSSSAKVLSKIFGLTEEVFEYNKCRKKCKANLSKDTKKEYDQITAKIEVKLINKYDNLKKELQAIEKENLVNNEGLEISVHNEETNPRHQEIIHLLKYIRALRTEFNI